MGNQHFGQLRSTPRWKTILIFLVLFVVPPPSTSLRDSLEVGFNNDFIRIPSLRGARKLSYNGEGRIMDNKGGAVREGIAGGIFLIVFFAMLYCAYRECLPKTPSSNSPPRATQQRQENFIATTDVARESIRDDATVEELSSGSEISHTQPSFTHGKQSSCSNSHTKATQQLPGDDFRLARDTARDCVKEGVVTELPPWSICTRLPVNGKYRTDGFQIGFCAEFLRLRFFEVAGRHDFYEIKGHGKFNLDMYTRITEGLVSTRTGRAYWVEKRLDHSVLSTGIWNFCSNSFEGECKRDDGTSTDYRTFELCEVHRRLPDFVMVSFCAEQYSSDELFKSWDSTSCFFEQRNNAMHLEIPHRIGQQPLQPSCYSFARHLLQAQGMRLRSINNNKNVTTMDDLNSILHQELKHAPVICLLFVNPNHCNCVRNESLMTISIDRRRHLRCKSSTTNSKAVSLNLYRCEEINGTLCLVQSPGETKDVTVTKHQNDHDTPPPIPTATFHHGVRSEYPIIQINDKTLDSSSLTAGQVNLMISYFQVDEEPLNFLVMTSTGDESDVSPGEGAIEKDVEKGDGDKNQEKSSALSPLEVSRADQARREKNGHPSMEWWFAKVHDSS